MDTTGINKLLDQARNHGDPNSVISLYQQAYHKSLLEKFPDGVASALFGQGLTYVDLGNFDKAIELFQKAYPFCKRSLYGKNNVALYYNNMAVAFFYQGKYELSNQYYHSALQEYKKNGVTENKVIAMIYNNLSTVQCRLGQWDQGLIYLNIAEQIARRVKSKYSLCFILGNKGNYYKENGKLDSAILYLQKGISIAKQINNPYVEAACNETLGDVFIINGQYTQAVSHLKRSYAIAKKAQIPPSEITTQFSLGEAYYFLHKYREAQTVLVSALKKAEDIRMLEDIERGYVTLAKVYEARNNLIGLAQTQKKIIALKDSLFTSEKAKAINLMEVKFRTAEKNKQIAQSKLKIANQEKNLARKNLWIGSILGGAVLILVLSLGLYRSIKHKQRLQSEQILTMKQEQNIGILKAMMGGEEKERARIARELHDGIGGMLAAAIMRFITIKQEHKEMAHNPAYNEVMGIMTEMGHEIRKTSHNLMPEVLMKQGLPEAIRAFCDRIQGKDLFIDVQIYGSLEPFTMDFKLSVYRIIQEMIKNIIQHAQATEAMVQLMMEGNVLSIIIEDDGVGFDTNQIKDGIGLQNLLSRIKSMNGQFTLESEPGKGTSVYIEFEITQEKSQSILQS